MAIYTHLPHFLLDQKQKQIFDTYIYIFIYAAAAAAMSNIPTSLTNSCLTIFLLAISASDPWPFSILSS
ncbi:hypothetical protein QVD17_23796 [Tagetes erecta]|uniref:Uncharacterized protein n=1 Tax=Tagetes erecta TaxID=13708 RepID=A0AAD8KJH0_TARER|nr:hypothetical protein QVD17_23796 [Tagetes erecta]